MSDFKRLDLTARFRTDRARLSESRGCIGKPLPAQRLSGALANRKCAARASSHSDELSSAVDLLDVVEVLRQDGCTLLPDGLQRLRAEPECLQDRRGDAQKDKDARWTKKNDASFFGYKNHLGVDKAHKLIRKWDATDAAVHDSQKLDDLLDLSNTGNGVWADSAYRSDQIEANLKAKGLQSRIHRRAARNHPLSERQKSANTTLSKVRARVEHVFGQQQNSMGGKIVRTIGIVRARFKIGMMNLGYNIRRRKKVVSQDRSGD